VTGSAGDSTVYVSAANEKTVRTVVVPRGYRLQQQAYDAAGKPVAADKKAPKTGAVTIAAGGFTVAKLVRN
jgi:hypothetical protein